MSDQDIQMAAADIVVSHGITPSSTLSQPIHVNDTTATVTDASHFVEQGFLVFPGWFTNPAAFDEPLPIAPGGINGHVISPDFESAGYNGFQHAQNSGTPVAANIYVGVPDNISEALTLGDAVVFTHVLNTSDDLTANRLRQQVHEVLVQYHRSLIRPQDSSIDTNLWALRQQKQARTDIDALAVAYMSNRRLKTSDGKNHAESLGRLGQSSGHVLRDWTKLTRDDVTQQMIGALRFVVREEQTTF